MSDLDDLFAAGQIETVGDILGDVAHVAEPVTPPGLDGQPEFPEPGIFFGMPEDLYHSINACSASLLKDMIVSPMVAWANSPLNPKREDDDTIFKTNGRAYHARICEGAAAYAERFAVKLDQADYPDALDTVADIKAAIVAAGGKPTIKGYDDNSRPAKKEDWSDQLLDLVPDAQIWDVIVKAHAAENAGATFVTPETHDRVELAARMIEADPELSKAFSGGHAEVSLFWHDAETGAPCKARVDYLKMQAFVDLKSFSLKGGRPVDREIDYQIASLRHYVPVCHYSDGIEAVKALVREYGSDVVNAVDHTEDGSVYCLCKEWALKWAKQRKPPTPLYVFQATGVAPITRGRILHRGTVFSVTHSHVRQMRRKYVECVRTFGPDPWLDLAPIRETTDEDVPLFGTDFGDR